MQLTINLSFNLSLNDILQGLSQLSLNDMEKVKKTLVKRELYFRKHKISSLNQVVSDFQGEGYSPEFLKDLTDGLQKSSVYKK